MLFSEGWSEARLGQLLELELLLLFADQVCRPPVVLVLQHLHAALCGVTLVSEDVGVE